MKDFQTNYRQLNAAQRQAVDTIDGPVMVVAGPGTGKTQLLGMRVANILQKTDALPHNILCLTFTESGAAAMRERLVSMIGPAAHKVAIHTFHSFGSEVISQNGEFFYHGAHFRPADELSSYEILNEIFDKLPHNHPLAGKMNEAYTHLRDTQSTISDLKKSGLTPDELGEILDRNDAFVAWLQPRLHEVCAPRLSKKSLPSYASLIDEVEKYQEPPLELITYQPLYQTIASSLRLAVESAASEDSTKPLTSWKSRHTEKRDDGETTLRDAKRSVKLRAAAGVYYDYLVAMQQRELYDFDDMILRVVHAMEVFPGLRLNLQEQYHYILVDEFQDTNDAQMRLLWNLTNNETQGGRPNILVVGDDDQAIYRFQGANISNILGFRDLYTDVQLITLRDNYRSAKPVLQLAREVILQGQERLESVIDEVDKTLNPHHQPQLAEVRHDTYTTVAEEYQATAMHLAHDIAADPARSRAIIARNHRQLRDILPYLQAENIPLSYERQDDVLESPPVLQLELLARIVSNISAQAHEAANDLMPELLAHPAWQIPPHELWQLSLQAYRSRSYWLEVMLETPGRMHDIAEWIIICSHESTHLPLETMLDKLFGTTDSLSADEPHEETDEPFADGPAEDFVSPLRAYFFPHDSLVEQPIKYLQYLHSLRSLRNKLREYRPDQTLLLADFVDFVALHRELGIVIRGGGEIENVEGSVTLLTAHKSKGLEFDDVYIVHLTDDVWGSSTRNHPRLISFPSNLPLTPAGDSDDERLRLLYVALTRAKCRLVLSSHTANDTQKPRLAVGALAGTSLQPSEHPTAPVQLLIHAAETDWRSAVCDPDPADIQQLLRPVLAHYRLSATSLANFLDLTRGGPQLFLLHNLLRFPQAMSPASAFGSSIHSALQRAHAHLAATGKRRPVEDVLHDFDASLAAHDLTDDEMSRLSRRGSEALQTFLDQRYDSFAPTQLSERSFATESIVVEGARITGAIDLIDPASSGKSLVVTDYKTGAASSSWQGRTEYEKIKLHHYQQQLMMYKLLAENSRQFAGYTIDRGVIEYVEPDRQGKIVRLDYEFDASELEKFRRLISGVWRRICSCDFTTPDLEPSLRGILEFESQLISSDQ